MGVPPNGSFVVENPMFHGWWFWGYPHDETETTRCSHWNMFVSYSFPGISHLNILQRSAAGSNIWSLEGNTETTSVSNDFPKHKVERCWKTWMKTNKPALDLLKVLLCFSCFNIIALLTVRLGLSKKQSSPEFAVVTLNVMFPIISLNIIDNFGAYAIWIHFRQTFMASIILRHSQMGIPVLLVYDPVELWIRNPIKIDLNKTVKWSNFLIKSRLLIQFVQFVTSQFFQV